MKIIKFHSARSYNNSKEIKEYMPSPTKNFFPEWWKRSSLYFKHPNGETHTVSQNDKKEEKALGFKSCPALLDSFSMGYVLRTPTDIMFVQHENQPYVFIGDEFKEFCSEREEMPEFANPTGYHKKHFHWWPNWGIETPKGYSLLVTNPINRFDFPFLTVSGIIDSDRYTSSGLMPFFLKEGFSGLIPKGTPFAQVIPIKRENWNSEYIYHDEDNIYNRFNETANMYRKPFGGIYKRSTWIKKEYE